MRAAELMSPEVEKLARGATAERRTFFGIGSGPRTERFLFLSGDLERAWKRLTPIRVT